jgi:hypothetical protein
VRWAQLVAVLQLHWIAQGQRDDEALAKAVEQAERLENCGGLRDRHAT